MRSRHGKCRDFIIFSVLYYQIILILSIFSTSLLSCKKFGSSCFQIRRFVVFCMKATQRGHDRAVKNGIKTFEVRKNDRDFRIGDTLYLSEINDDGEYVITELGLKVTPIEAIVTYILTHDDFPAGVPEGYVVMSIQVIG